MTVVIRHLKMGDWLHMTWQSSGRATTDESTATFLGELTRAKAMQHHSKQRMANM